MRWLSGVAALACLFSAVPASAQSAKGYLIIEHAVVTPDIAERLKPYSAATRPLLAEFEGRFVIAGGKTVEAVEGGWQPPFVAVIEFPSLERARAFYRSPGYQAVLPLRLAALPDSKAFLVEGTAQP